MDFENIRLKAWELYVAETDKGIADYTKHDALYDATVGASLSDAEYEKLLELMNDKQ